MEKKKQDRGKFLFLKRLSFVSLVLFMIILLLAGTSDFIVGKTKIFSNLPADIREAILLRQEGVSGERGLFGPGDITASINASRTTCVAPCAVFFDATDTIAVTTSRPFHELDYTWDFGINSKVFGGTGRVKIVRRGLSRHIFLIVLESML